uniref:Uncharacterized protein n=1 Tax=Arundo donax TaxID=35708 RepID=A0A0A9ARE9_ARUDO
MTFIDDPLKQSLVALSEFVDLFEPSGKIQQPVVKFTQICLFLP